jgi:hypothetical protein
VTRYIGKVTNGGIALQHAQGIPKRMDIFVFMRGSSYRSLPQATVPYHSLLYPSVPERSGGGEGEDFSDTLLSPGEPGALCNGVME